jgi:hypothetical protein
MDASALAPRDRLDAIRTPLLDLHRALLERERRAYEQAQGHRVAPNELLKLALEHDQFAWLLPLSALIVRVDELLAGEQQPTDADVAVIAREVRRRLRVSEHGTVSEQLYDRAIQNDPAVLLTYRAVMRALPDSPDDEEKPT